MGDMRDRSFALHEQMEAQEKRKQILFEQQRKQREDEYMRIESIKEAAQKRVNNFYAYKDNVVKTLVTTAIRNLCVESMTNPSAYEISVTEALVGQYVEDKGARSLLKQMKNSKNGLLRKIYEEADVAEKEITKDADKDDETTLVIRKDNVDDFWKAVDDTEDVDDITNMIRLRVANAEEEFVNRNLQDKNNIDTILKDTAQRVQNAKSGYDNEYAERVEESETRIAKDRIYKIQHESHRNVFDNMVRALSEAIMKDEVTKNEFVNESSRLNVNKVVECARCMYTLLEVVSTIQLEKVDERYIQDTLNSIRN